MQVITKDHSRSQPYVETLLREIDTVSSALKNSNKLVSQIHFGGGTPNFIQPDEMRAIMHRIHQHFKILPDAEIAIEMHPKSNTEEFSAMLKEQGFNRISLGVQDFDTEVQTLINRHQTFELTKTMLDMLRGLGFKHFNFDLIYGLPGQTPTKFANTFEKTLTLKPNRLAVYSYAHVPWVRPIQRSFKDTDLPNPEMKLKLCEMAIEFFAQHGFQMIGMDHYADEHDELFLALKNKSIHRNFMGYTTRADAHQIGFGVSSISYAGGNYFQNAKKIDDYAQRVDAGSLATFRGCLLTPEDKIRRDLITELMCHRGVDKIAFGETHNLNFNEHFKADLTLLQSFIEDELLIHNDSEIRISDQGLLVMRNIAMCFDEHLDTIRKNARNPVFSRTV